jgi:hypothetical protein
VITVGMVPGGIGHAQPPAALPAAFRDRLEHCGPGTEPDAAGRPRPVTECGLGDIDVRIRMDRGVFYDWENLCRPPGSGLLSNPSGKEFCYITMEGLSTTIYYHNPDSSAWIRIESDSRPVDPEAFLSRYGLW